MVEIATEKDPERLRQVALLQARELTLVRRRLSVLTERLAKETGQDQQALLQEELHRLEAELGDTLDDNPLDSQSERRRPDGEFGPKTPNTPQTGHGPCEQPDLEIVEEVCELDEADQICPKCGGDLKPIEGQYESSQEIDAIAVRYELIEVKRQKYRCTCSDCQHIETALGSDEPKPRERGRYRVGFCVETLLHKYRNHLPLERQTKMMASAGLKVRTSTLWDQHWACALLLEPTWEELKDYQLSQEVVGADETRWRLMSGKKAKPQVFALTSESAVYYAIANDKKTETVDALLEDFMGWLIVDGLSTYPAVRSRRLEAWYHNDRAGPEPFRIAGCWAHARRYFVKAAKNWPIANEMLDMIALLYRIETGVHSYAIDDSTRRSWMKATFKRMREWMYRQRPVPGSTLERAIKYLDRFWKRLVLVAEHPELWLDNNPSERALRSVVLGRKNHYGSRSRAGMKAAAIFYSLVETCDLLGISPRDYLTEALTRAINEPGSAYLPHAYARDIAE